MDRDVEMGDIEHSSSPDDPGSSPGVDDQGLKATVSFQSTDRNNSKSLSRYSSHYNSFVKEEKEAPLWKDTIWLAYQTLGVVYGDLGTSPLYVFPTIQLQSGDERDYLGILSIIFWTLTLIGVVKYVAIVLRADDHGEGGTFALYSLLCRHANVGKYVGKHFGRLESDTEFSHFGKAEHVYVHTKAKQFLERNPVAQTLLILCVMIGTCMVIGDGVLTPAISVVSAASGLHSKVPAISQAVVIVISCVILVGLFLLQGFGTSKVSCIFSPVMAVWFTSTTGIGIYNIIKFYPNVFKGLSPHYMVRFFLHNRRKGWEMLGAIVLCITGAEAMFADLGHFKREAVQLAFTVVVYPALIVTYAGQTAYLIVHPEDRSDAFFKSVPRVIYWPVFVISTLAAIVASQALISATFSVLKQSMSFGCFPRIKMIHTSSKQEGQIYSPEVNYLLMVLCLAVVLIFQNGADLGHAFGIAVMCVMLITTFLVSLVMLVVWRTSVVWILLFFTFFGTVETIYLSAVTEKLLQGGWVPFCIAAVFVTVSFSWKYGRGMKYEFEAKNRITSHEFGELCSSLDVKRVPGMSLFYSNLIHGGLPPLMVHYTKLVGALHQVIIFLSIRVVPVKTVLENERLSVSRGGFRGLYRCVARYGYMDTINAEELLDQVVDSLIQQVRLEFDASIGKAGSGDVDIAVAEFKAQMEISQLDNARQRGTVHVVGHSILKTASKNWIKRFVVNKVYKLLHECSRSAVSAFKIPSSRLLELSMVYET